LHLCTYIFTGEDMTQDEIIEMTRQAGGFDATPKFLEAFANLVAQHEREACAKVCDDLWQEDGTAYQCREAIKARGKL
jgi:hypothetical protein